MTRDDNLRPGTRLANPLAGNPLVTRADLQRALHRIFEPLLPHFSPSGARVRLGSSAVLYGAESEELEGFARPLYGIVPLHVGGGRFDHWAIYRRGLVHGTDPEHPDFWGVPRTDQRLVEMAALGFALAYAADEVWQPLSGSQRRRVVQWLAHINEHPLPNCNWHFFRVLVNLGLRSVDAPHDPEQNQQSLDALESHYDSAGVYHDGQPERIDYYVPWAYHTYGLIYAASPHAAPDVAARYRERARQFADAYQYRFDSAGRAIPFGRSLTYRFAQAAFWSALAFADEPALPWGRLKGLLLRNLRYWSTLPIADRDGVLTQGYAYSQTKLCEPYTSTCSPYWCTKAFLALAAPPEHPFWLAAEEPADVWEGELAPVRAEPVSGAVFQRDASQAVMLSAGQHDMQWPDTSAKYGKFAYSSAFGFSVSPDETAPAHGVHDSMLALREDEGRWRVRVQSTERRQAGAWLACRWQPWPDVEIRTLLVATGMPWHLRLHRIQTGRALHVSERGFALGRGPSDHSEVECAVTADGGAVLGRTELGASGMFDLTLDGLPDDAERCARRAELLTPLPGTNVVWPRTVLPCLTTHIEPGASWLGCAVLATEARLAESVEALRGMAPRIPADAVSWWIR